MKLIIAALSCAFAVSAFAESGYRGECNVLIQTIRSTELWKENGFPMSQIKTIIDNNMRNTSIGHVATQNERDQWYFQAAQIFSGMKLDSQWVAESVGRFCKPPYTTIEYGTQSQTPPDDFNRRQSCQQKGIVFMMAAEDRDAGRSPQEAYKIISGAYLHEGAPYVGINKDGIKQAINLVYFDPGFTNARGPRFSDQVRDYCMRDGKPQFQPLK